MCTAANGLMLTVAAIENIKLGIDGDYDDDDDDNK
jgi:hypothetical protein